jgi:hypothetical protein
LLCLLIFGLEKKTFPAGRPLDKNRNGIHDATKNTCKPRLEKKEQKLTRRCFFCRFVSLKRKVVSQKSVVENRREERTPVVICDGACFICV